MGMNPKSPLFILFSLSLAMTILSSYTMARTLPSSSLDQLDFYRPDKTLMISKKSATALNKLMIALRSIDKSSAEKGNGLDSPDTVKYNPAFEPFNMQRRNQKERKIFLRCYFNAVSCF